MARFQSVSLNDVKFSGDDAVLPFFIEQLDTRGRAVQMGPALNAILSRHDYPAPVARLLAEMIVLTVLLGTSLKFSGQFIVQSQTDGPVNLLVVDFRTPGDIRAYARFDDHKLQTAIEAQQTSPESLLGKGVLAMTIDQGQHMQRYQGMVELNGNTLEDVAHAYFLQSEQIPTKVRLGVGELTIRDESGGTKTSWRAGGILTQFLPDSGDRVKHRDLPGGDGAPDIDFEEDNDWVEAQALLATVQDHELTDPDISVETLLFRLFNEHGFRIFEAQKISDQCSCNGEKIWAVLKAMPNPELAEIEKNGNIEVKCEFCATDYSITLEELGQK